MITKIGIVSGEIIGLLEKKALPLDAHTIAQEIAEDKDVVLMGIGWLAREGFIDVEKKDDAYYVLRLNPRAAKA